MKNIKDYFTGKPIYQSHPYKFLTNIKIDKVNKKISGKVSATTINELLCPVIISSDKIANALLKRKKEPHNVVTKSQTSDNLIIKTNYESAIKNFREHKSVFVHGDPPYNVSTEELAFCGIDANYQSAFLKEYNTSTTNEKDKLAYDSGMKSITSTINEKKSYYFGVEMETSEGYVISPTWGLKYGINCTRDGSISGKEYVTIPLYGDFGFMALNNICKIINKKCKIDSTCGLHIHIGGNNISFNKEFLLLYYKLMGCLEEEIFEMVAHSRRSNSACKWLPWKLPSINFSNKNNAMEYEYEINKLYEKLFIKYHGNKVPGEKTNKNHTHERGMKCGYDRHTMRYCWLNMLPAMMLCHSPSSISSVTGTLSLEIRNHEMTLDFDLIKNWILLHMGIVWYAENMQSKIIEKNNFTLAEILTKAYPASHLYLINYVNNKKEYFKKNSLDNEYEIYNKPKNIYYATLKEMVEKQRKFTTN